MMYQEEAGRQSVLILFLCTQLKTEASMDFWSFFLPLTAFHSFFWHTSPVSGSSSLCHLLLGGIDNMLPRSHKF